MNLVWPGDIFLHGKSSFIIYYWQLINVNKIVRFENNSGD